LAGLIEGLRDRAEHAADGLSRAFGSRGGSGCCAGSDGILHSGLTPGNGGAGESDQEKPKRLHGNVLVSDFITLGPGTFGQAVTSRGGEHLPGSVGIGVSDRNAGGTLWQEWGMKKYVRAVLDDLKSKTKKKGNPVVPQDLQNQTLSKDPQQRVRQLDYQAQKDEERLS
jgi:hypothetical protein